MAADIFVARQGNETLRDFSERIGHVLNIGSITRSESSNYVDDEYFIGSALGVAVIFAWADETDIDNFDFWIHCKPDKILLEDMSWFDGLADLLARRLTLGGDRVLRLADAAKKGGKKFLYTLPANASSADQIKSTVSPIATPIRFECLGTRGAVGSGATIATRRLDV